ncbi:glycosyltransferase [Aurantimonas sp. Leaf443]|uniref:glycosyltransferase n=1 Tax=Aurantimonas sp. Leaf443 TaxID=1736378 RepID=UPI0006FC700F|nr:glycosyltransferase [Aurantimonas sp. Leaf443]KQT85125.1 glycosyl transferase family 1 [Aurantimonas sp. Leaf443]
MKVLHFFKTYWPDTFGGIERTIEAIARSTAELGVETTVLSLSDTPEKGRGSFNGHRILKARRDFDLASTGFSREVFGAFRAAAAEADLVHYHFPWPLMDVVHFAVPHGKPAIVTYHSDIVRQKLLKRVYRPVMTRFLGRMDRIVATSPDYLASSEVLSRFASKCAVIPIGLADREGHVDEALAARWRVRFPRPFFLFTGVLRYYKGLEFLIDAASSVDCDIVIIGRGPMEGQLVQRAASAGASNVHFMGELDDADKEALLRLCTGFVFPSHERSEAFGLALLEAAMFGRPMISTAIGTGTSYINRHDMTGLVVAPADPEALAAAMAQMVADPGKAKRWGHAARERYLALFTDEAMGKAYGALYRELAEQAASRS